MPNLSWEIYPPHPTARIPCTRHTRTLATTTACAHTTTPPCTLTLAPITHSHLCPQAHKNPGTHNRHKFRLMQSSVLQSKSIGQLVDYYYGCWKQLLEPLSQLWYGGEFKVSSEHL